MSTDAYMIYISITILTHICLCYASELTRYFNAAAEAAQEVLEAQGENSLLNVDLAKLATLGLRPLDSPGRLVALQLANGNPLFRFIALHSLAASCS